MGRRRAKESANSPVKRASRGQRRLTQWAFLLLLLVVGLVAAAPTIISNTPLLHEAVQFATGDVNGTVTVQSANLGWFSPVQISKIVVKGAQGEAVAEIESVATEKTLLSLAKDYTTLGNIVIRQPRIRVVTRPGGSNVEDLIAEDDPEDEDDDEGDPSAIRCTVQVVDGEIQVASTTPGDQWALINLQSTTQVNTSVSEIVKSRLQGVVQATNVPAAPIEVQMALSELPTSADNVVAANEAMSDFAVAGSIQSQQLPLAILNAALVRIETEAALAGTVDSNIAFRWSTKDGFHVAAQKCNVQALQVVAPEVIGTDVLQLSQLHVSGDVTQQQDLVKMTDFQVLSDIGQFNASGTLPLAISSVDDLVSDTSLVQLDCRGHLELAKFAELLPNTLKIREGTKVTAGRIELSAQAAGRPRRTEVAGERRDERIGSGRQWQADSTLAARDGIADCRAARRPRGRRSTRCPLQFFASDCQRGTATR